MSRSGPACPVLQRLWKSKGCTLGEAARIVAENDDVRDILTNEDAMPVSVGILGHIYGLTSAEAKAAVLHWLRRIDAGKEGQ